MQLPRNRNLFIKSHKSFIGFGVEVLDVKITSQGAPVALHSFSQASCLLRSGIEHKILPCCSFEVQPKLHQALMPSHC
jgi:hypothetical protein